MEASSRGPCCTGHVNGADLAGIRARPPFLFCELEFHNAQPNNRTIHPFFCGRHYKLPSGVRSPCTRPPEEVSRLFVGEQIDRRSRVSGNSMGSWKKILFPMEKETSNACIPSPGSSAEHQTTTNYQAELYCDLVEPVRSTGLDRGTSLTRCRHR